MPELPEVYTIAHDLDKNIVGFTIKNIQISKNYKIPTEELRKLKGAIGSKILGSENIAKNIVLKVSNNVSITFHLAMTGRILLREYGDKMDNWVKVVFEIAKGSNKLYLRFCDMRQFGKIRVLTKQELAKYLEKYGLDPLDSKFNSTDLLKSLLSKKTTIKNALLDQSIVFGLGNIYATDALFLSNLNPKTSTQELDIKDAQKLVDSIREILKEGIKNRGSTLPDKMYVDIFGNSGRQQNHFRIYGKLKCITCGGKVSFEKLNGRGTYFCETCQPLKTEKLDGKKLGNIKLEINKKQKKLL